MTEPTAAALPPKPEKVSVFEDIVEIFYAPSKVFARHQTGRYGAALAIVAVLMGLIVWATADIFEPITRAMVEQRFAEAMKANPNISPEMLEQQREMMDMMSGLGAVFTPLFTVVQVFLLGLGIWVVGKIFGSAQAFGAAVAVSTFGLFPRLIETIVGAAQLAFLMEPGTVTAYREVSLGIGRFLGPETTPMVSALASQVGIFPLWSAFLVYVGYRVMGRLTPAKAAIGAAVVWLFGVLFASFAGL